MEPNQLVLLGFFWVLNFGISWWNSRQVGLVWEEAMHIKGFAKVLVWMGAIMAIIGFSWCILIIELVVGHIYFPQNVTIDIVEATFALWYLIAIIPLLGIGMTFWALSLYQAWVRRDAASIGVAAWNTYAQIHNTADAIRGIPAATKALQGAFRDKNAAQLMLILLLAASSIVLGTWLAFSIINHYAGRRDLDTPIFPNEEKERLSA